MTYKKRMILSERTGSIIRFFVPYGVCVDCKTHCTLYIAHCTLFVPLWGVWVATDARYTTANFDPVSSPMGRVGCNLDAAVFSSEDVRFVPYGARGLQHTYHQFHIHVTSFVPYGACGLQRRAKIRLEKPHDKRLF